MRDVKDTTAGSRALLFASRLGASQDVVSLLERRGVRVMEQPLDVGAERLVRCVRPDVILIQETESAPGKWQQMASEAGRAHPAVPVILLTAGGSEELVIAALRLGVRDYLRLPVSDVALSGALDRCLGRNAPRPKRLEGGGESRLDPMVGSSEIFCHIRSYMMRAAASDCTVLITGETGTGKELAAGFIHDHSRRRDKPFVCVNCAAIPDPLLESELFGHTRGAFTGAESLREGLLASAEGGTVLLDEIGDMSLSAQAKILRVLEKKEVSRLGGTQQRKIDVRFVAATNQDLESMANRGTFRRDLYYRLNVARVELPPLRERRDDIPLLVEHYRRRLGGDDVSQLSEDCLRRISRYNWPGNIRELKNVLENIFFNCGSGEIHAQHLPPCLRETAHPDISLPADERERLVEALCSTQWNKSRAAEVLHWSRMTLYRKMAKYRISRSSPPAGPA